MPGLRPGDRDGAAVSSKKEVLAVLRHEEQRAIGETPPGSNMNDYVRWYFKQLGQAPYGIPWCAVFQCWAEDAAGGLLMPLTAYTPTMAQHFIDKKRFGKVPKVGALAFHNFPDSLDRIQHVSRVVKVINATSVQTIEGNTSSGTAGSQDDGGNVYDRYRYVRSGDIVGFGYPEYEKDLPEFFFPKEKTWFGRNDSGADIKTWQRDLNAWIKGLKRPPADFHLDITKTFDKPTLKATKTFQAFYDLDVDGRVGAHTIRQMERVRARQT
jgi:hypothetical protein